MAKKLLVAILLLSCTFATLVSTSPIRLHPRNEEKWQEGTEMIPDHYIITLKNGVDLEEGASTADLKHFRCHNTARNWRSLECELNFPPYYFLFASSARTWIEGLFGGAESGNNAINHTYDMEVPPSSTEPPSDPDQGNGSFKGFSGTFTAGVIQQIGANTSIINAIEHDHRISLQTIVQKDPPWNLARISQRDLPLGDTYAYPDTAGSFVDVYVIDTGVRVSHEEFDVGRAVHGVDFTGEGADDMNGHGTHIAGTIAGKTVGVAKKANIIAVKVLDASGLGSWSNVIAGINWMVQKVVKGRRKSVANISIGGPKVNAVNAATETAIAAGIHFTIAAGNNGRDACGYSPASANGVISVGATSPDDEIKPWSNYGPCVTVFAPGQDILSSYIMSDTDLQLLSGTSMSSPHVAGMLALALQRSRYSPMTLKTLLINHTTTDRIQNVDPLANTPNRLLYIWTPKYR